jgi:hypothetical protein
MTEPVGPEQPVLSGNTHVISEETPRVFIVTATIWTFWASKSGEPYHFTPQVYHVSCSIATEDLERPGGVIVLKFNVAPNTYTCSILCSERGCWPHLP